MDMSEYQRMAAETAIYQDKMYPVASLMVEAAEFADLFIKPRLRGDDRPLDRDEIISEAGDVLWNLANALNDVGIPLSEVAYGNISKVKSRQERGVIKGDGGNR